LQPAVEHDRLIRSNAFALFVFPAKAGTHFGYGHRPSPVWPDFAVTIDRPSPRESCERL
jgi:hypothetical protein